MADSVTTQTWMIEGMPHRRATLEEVYILQQEVGAPHVTFACPCGCVFWTAKSIALSASGHYNSMRNIFYHGNDHECACPLSRLVCVVPMEGEHNAE